MKIDILTHDGSPLGVHSDDIYGTEGRVGVGGSELYLLTLCEEWHKKGYDVTLFNNPTRIGSPFKQKYISEFKPEAERDALVVFRSPNPLVKGAKGRKIWLSCDQETVGDFKEFACNVDEIAVISKTHQTYFLQRYGVANTTIIEIPVREHDYAAQVQKKRFQCLYCSMPDRGLDVLSFIWPHVLNYIPEAKLKITSGWALWNGTENSEKIKKYQNLFSNTRNVEYLGALKRREMVRVQQESELMVYPCTFPELFCISAAECQYAGTIPITSTVGALRDTNMGVIVPLPDYSWSRLTNFAEKVAETLIDKELSKKQENLSVLAKDRFSLAKALDSWDNLLCVRK